MSPSLRQFVTQFLGVVLAALIPVVLVTFLSIPYALGGHPGEARSPASTAGGHMT